MKRLLKPLLPVLALVAAGCGIGPHVDDYNEAMVAWWQATCTCDGWKPEFSSEGECRAERPPSGAEQACLETLFKNVGGDYEAQLDCAAAAYNRAAACVNSKTCTDLARWGCGVDLATDLNDCPDLPNDVLQEHNECLN